MPGAYQVRVTAAGTTVTRPIEVRMDPRLKGVSAADLQAQFELATKIRDRVSAANDAVLRIRRLRSEAADRVARARAEPVTRAADAATLKLREVEERLYQVRNRSGQDPLNFSIKLNNRLAALGRSVQTGDARPTAAAYRVYDELSGELDRELQQLDRVVAGEVAGLNRILSTRGLPPVSGQGAARRSGPGQ